MELKRIKITSKNLQFPFNLTAQACGGWIEMVTIWVLVTRQLQKLFHQLAWTWQRSSQRLKAFMTKRIQQLPNLLQEWGVLRSGKTPIYNLCSILALVGVLSVSSGLIGTSEARAGRIGIFHQLELAQKSGEKATQISPALANKLRQDLSKRIGVPSGKLRVVESTRKTWSDGCLGLPKPNEMCSMALVQGWRVVLSDGNRRWVYRTDSQGRNLRIEGDRSTSLQPTRIPGNEMPPALSQGAIFQTISSGGFTGYTYETTLWSDGRLVRVRINPTAMVKPEVHHLSQQQVRQFRELLASSGMSKYHRLNFPATPGAADYITVTMVSRAGVIRYAETIQDQLPSELQTVVQAWNQMSRVG